jgi:hypothetical protein
VQLRFLPAGRNQGHTPGKEAKVETRTHLSLFRRLALGLALTAVFAMPLAAQATASVPCTARIRPREAADYDLSAEVVLRGRVVGQQDGMLLLRIAAGTVRIDAGSASSVAGMPAEASIEVVGAKLQEGGRQRLLAREIWYTGGHLVLRDALGRPLPTAAQL